MRLTHIEKVSAIITTAPAIVPVPILTIQRKRKQPVGNAALGMRNVATTIELTARAAILRTQPLVASEANKSESGPRKSHDQERVSNREKNHQDQSEPRAPQSCSPNAE
jgi:hypothetical protein